MKAPKPNVALLFFICLAGTLLVAFNLLVTKAWALVPLQAVCLAICVRSTVRVGAVYRKQRAEAAKERA